ncbi:MAG: cache domain-containing protein, partial [Atribacterota bacterium]
MKSEMKKKERVSQVSGTYLLSVMCLMMILVGPVHAATQELPDPETQPVMTFVQKAAALIEKEGEKIFPEFEKKGSGWFSGDQYVFGLDLTGTRVIFPPDPSTVGTNVWNLQDEAGKFRNQIIINEVSGPKSSGWVHYMIPRPGETTSRWKSSYVMRVKAPSGKEYVIGSGLYDMKMNKIFIVDLVDDAATLINKMGQGAFPILQDKTGPFIFQDVYIFVYTDKGINQVLPYNPEKEGTDLSNVQDQNG